MTHPLPSLRFDSSGEVTVAFAQAGGGGAGSEGGEGAAPVAECFRWTGKGSLLAMDLTEFGRSTQQENSGN